MADSSPCENMSIDDLPQHIVLHILSFLPTNKAIATSVLSRRWKHLWTLVPALDFSFKKSFESLKIEVVDNAFKRNKSLFMRRLSLPKIHGITQSDLSSYVSYAIQRNVQELDLNLDDKKIVFPCSINTLVVLKLSTTYSSNGNLLLGDEIRFPSLKIFHLDTITLETRDSSLLGFSSSRFPLLEEMVLCGAKFNHHRVHISLPTLTRLEIMFAEFKYELKIQSLDSLRYLVFDGSIRRDFHLENHPNIVEAEFGIFPKSLTKDRIRDDKEVINIDGESLIRIVNSVSQAKILKFSGRTMEGLCKASLNSWFHSDSIQVFPNLVKMELDLDVSVIDAALTIMLHKFENLERLKIDLTNKIHLSLHSWSYGDSIRVFHNLVEIELRLGDSQFNVAMIMLHKFENLQHLTLLAHYGGVDKISWAPPTHVPDCLTRRLMTFCFRGFIGTKDAMEVTKYILKNSLVLVNAKIVFHGEVRFKKGCRTQSELSTACIGSVGCELEFDQWDPYSM